MNCKHNYNWNNQRTIDSKQYGECSHCDTIVRIEHQGWSYSGDTIGYAGIEASPSERNTYLN